jgi:anti-anti-sigma factor
LVTPAPLVLGVSGHNTLRRRNEEADVRYAVDEWRGLPVLHTWGDLGEPACRELERVIDAATEWAGNRLVIDVSGSTTAGICLVGLLLSAQDKLGRQGGGIAVCCPSLRIGRLLEQARLAEKFAIVGTVDEAAQALSQAGAAAR